MLEENHPSPQAQRGNTKALPLEGSGNIHEATGPCVISMQKPKNKDDVCIVILPEYGHLPFFLMPFLLVDFSKFRWPFCLILPASLEPHLGAKACQHRFRIWTGP